MKRSEIPSTSFAKPADLRPAVAALSRCPRTLAEDIMKACKMDDGFSEGLARNQAAYELKDAEYNVAFARLQAGRGSNDDVALATSTTPEEIKAKFDRVAHPIAASQLTYRQGLCSLFKRVRAVYDPIIDDVILNLVEREERVHRDAGVAFNPANSAILAAAVAWRRYFRDCLPLASKSSMPGPHVITHLVGRIEPSDDAVEPTHSAPADQTAPATPVPALRTARQLVGLSV